MSPDHCGCKASLPPPAVSHWQIHKHNWTSCPLQIKEDDGEPLRRGTRVTLHLKDDATDLADQKKLEDLIKQYSEFISFPIR